ncbi:glycoside hydrolase family 25 protein [Corynebacterium sp. 335C]
MSRRAARHRTGIAAAATAMTLAFTGMAVPAQAFTATSPDGIDVSKWQHTPSTGIDWETVADAGTKFAIIKATDGHAPLSKHFEEDSKGAHEAGLIIGAYHYGRPTKDPVKQADEFVKALELQPEGAAKLPPVLDMEVDEGLSAEKVSDWAQKFLDRVEEKTGEKPMIYTYRWFWRQQMANTEKFADYPLWLAAYQDTPPTDIPGGWDEVSVWQRSGSGRVDGIITPVDLNTFNGSQADLEAFAKGDSDAAGRDSGAGRIPGAGRGGDGAGQLPGSFDPSQLDPADEGRPVPNDPVTVVDGDGDSGTTNDAGRVDTPEGVDEPDTIGGSPVVSDSLLELILSLIEGSLSASAPADAAAEAGRDAAGETADAGRTEGLAHGQSQLLAAVLGDVVRTETMAQHGPAPVRELSARDVAELIATLEDMAAAASGSSVDGEDAVPVTLSDVIAALNSVGR